jgi:hypothetical protein
MRIKLFPRVKLPRSNDVELHLATTSLCSQVLLDVQTWCTTIPRLFVLATNSSWWARLLSHICSPGVRWRVKLTNTPKKGWKHHTSSTDSQPQDSLGDASKQKFWGHLVLASAPYGLRVHCYRPCQHWSEPATDTGSIRHARGRVQQNTIFLKYHG